MGLILDTSALVAWERAQDEGREVLLDGGETLVMPAVVWAEALAGVRLADSASRAARRLARLEALRRLMGVEPFTADTAEHHADIFAELTHSGSMIPQNDLMVAATARCLGCGVLVGPKDEAHFRRVAGLLVQVLGVSQSIR
jgi:predicted nucleic acid-binding protein